MRIFKSPPPPKKIPGIIFPNKKGSLLASTHTKEGAISEPTIQCLPLDHKRKALRRVLDSKLLQLGHFFRGLGTEVRMVTSPSQEGGIVLSPWVLRVFPIQPGKGVTEAVLCDCRRLSNFVCFFKVMALS